ncbi:hypothetical protein [Roseimaritima sediminicola]|uniref:hypothetical protein n=1 Tax=Roseimaritima sediminicola TaxID=2662066 RepID=UPI001298245E|nr:hypothetical protein [Roseimaritima sediminicola]
MLHKTSLLAAGLGLLLATGCGDTRNELTVSGTVTVNGEPIENGTISFVAADGVAATGGGVIKDGSYTAFVAPGRKKVVVLGNKAVGEEPLYQGVPDSPTQTTYQTITPTKYNAAHLTPLTAEISENQEGLDFELTGDPPSAQELAG